MYFSKDGEFHRVVRVTGPAHNILGLSFSRRKPEEVAVIKLRDAPAATIDESRLRQAIFSGVTAANAEFGCEYLVDRIQYDPSDTPDLDVYAALARTLVERVHHETRAATPVGGQR